MKDIYSGFGFYVALAADLYAATGDPTGGTVGPTIDLQGYNGATIVFLCNSFASAGNPASLLVTLHHGLPSTAGVSVWSNVPASRMLHSVYQLASTTNSGQFASFISTASVVSTVLHIVGYRGDPAYRYLRVCLASAGGAPSSLYAAALAILGYPENWPVNSPA